MSKRPGEGRTDRDTTRPLDADLPPSMRCLPDRRLRIEDAKALGRAARETDPLVYDPDRDEDGLGEWRSMLAGNETIYRQC